MWMMILVASSSTRIQPREPKHPWKIRKRASARCFVERQDVTEFIWILGKVPFVELGAFQRSVCALVLPVRQDPIPELDDAQARLDAGFAVDVGQLTNDVLDRLDGVSHRASGVQHGTMTSANFAMVLVKLAVFNVDG